MKLVVVLLLTLITIRILLLIFTRFERTITIATNTPFGTSSYGKGGIVYNIVSDTNGNVYKLRNDLFILHFRAAEVQAKLKPGATFKVRGYGLRIPILGMYPIIYKVE